MIGTIVRWFFGILFALTALSSLLTFDWLHLLITASITIILIPSLNEKLIPEKWGLSGWKMVSVVFCLWLLLLFVPADTSDDNVITDGLDDIASELDELDSKIDDLDAVVTEKVTEEVVEEEVVSYKIGSEVPVDYLTYKVTKVESFTEMGSTFMKEETSGKFIKVYLNIENTAMETKDVFSSRAKIVDSKGRSFDRFSGDSLYIADALEFGAQLQPGLSEEGAMVFELPKDASGLMLEISGDWLSSSKVSVELNSISNIGKDTTSLDENDAMMDELMGDI